MPRKHQEVPITIEAESVNPRQNAPITIDAQPENPRPTFTEVLVAEAPTLTQIRERIADEKGWSVVAERQRHDEPVAIIRHGDGAHVAFHEILIPYTASVRGSKWDYAASTVHKRLTAPEELFDFGLLLARKLDGQHVVSVDPGTVRIKGPEIEQCKKWAVHYRLTGDTHSLGIDEKMLVLNKWLNGGLEDLVG